MHSLSEENHIKAIYKLSGAAGEPASTNSLSQELGMKASSETDILKKLADKKLVNYEKYKGVSLTNSGMKLALSIVRKHRLWETFLVKELEFGWDEVHEIAEQLEHIKSADLIDRLDSFLGYPKVDPHGDPIPDINGKVIRPKLQTLADGQVGQKGVIANITHHDKEFLHYLERNDLLLGVSLQIDERLEFDGSLGITVKKKGQRRISREVAEKILIDVAG